MNFRLGTYYRTSSLLTNKYSVLDAVSSLSCWSPVLKLSSLAVTSSSTLVPTAVTGGGRKGYHWRASPYYDHREKKLLLKVK